MQLASSYFMGPTHPPTTAAALQSGNATARPHKNMAQDKTIDREVGYSMEGKQPVLCDYGLSCQVLTHQYLSAR